MKKEWYYAENNMSDDALVDNFVDSKFGIDKWSSFAREIVQNSLDAVDDEDKPVEVVIDLNNNLSLEDIPGGNKIRDVLRRCYEAATNKQTKRAYAKGIEILNKDKVYCMKISDYNTKGVKSGRDEAWGALVFDEGKSVKQRPGSSAGSHGVGKKVPFIISTCNTVFYSTKNKYIKNGCEKSEMLMQGKTVLITWKDENDVRRYHKGWYGLYDESQEESREKIKPLNDNYFNTVNEYFTRSDRCGTDVIIVGVNAYGIEEKIKKYIISAILSNFFVAIKENKLVITIFGEIINSSNFEYVVNKYYDSSDEKSENTPLTELLEIYNNVCKENIKLNLKNEEIGNIDIYFKLGNDNNKKRYVIFRDHGMRIKENVTRPDQPYTCFVIVRGKKINQLLSELENAAHDNFIIEDENMDMNEEAVKAYKKMVEDIRLYIVNKCKIENVDEQEIEGLNSILSIPGQWASVRKKKYQVKKRKNNLKKREKGKSDSKGVGIGGYSNGKGMSKRRGIGKGSIKEPGNIEGILYEDYIIEPVFIKEEKKYIIRFKVDREINNATVIIHSVNSENKIDDTMENLIKEAYVGPQKRKIVNGRIEKLKFKSNQMYEIILYTKDELVSKMKATMYIKE